MATLLTVSRKYDGHKLQGEIVKRTAACVDIQFPGYRIPVRFRQSRTQPDLYRDQGDTRGLFFLTELLALPHMLFPVSR